MTTSCKLNTAVSLTIKALTVAAPSCVKENYSVVMLEQRCGFDFNHKIRVVKFAELLAS